MFVRKTKCSLMSSGIKKYDFYRKAIDGLQTKTSVGGLSERRCVLRYEQYR